MVASGFVKIVVAIVVFADVWRARREPSASERYPRYTTIPRVGS